MRFRDEAHFNSDFNCAQAVLAAYCGDFGLDQKTVYKSMFKKPNAGNLADVIRIAYERRFFREGFSLTHSAIVDKVATG